MSKYKTVKVDWTEAEHIMGALTRLGIPFTDHRKNPVAIQDYYGTTAPQRASILVSKADVLKLPGLTNREMLAHYCPVGFARNEDGSWNAIFDEAHGRSAASVLVDRMKQHYTASAAVSRMKIRGWEPYIEQDDSGTLEIKMRKVAA